MKLLFDHNLSPKLVRRLNDLFPESDHLFPRHLDQASDPMVWDYARIHGFIIVSKDRDFSDRSVLLGHPPKVIRLHLGNCTTAAVETLLRSHFILIREFEKDERKSCLHLPSHPWLE